MSGEVVKIDNIYLAILIKKELEKKGIEKDKNLGLQQLKKEELEQIEDLNIINTNIGEIEELEKLPNLRNLKISSVNMRTMIKGKMMTSDDRYNYESKLSGIKDFSVIEKLGKLEFLQIDNEENLRKINTENLKNLVSLKLRDNPNLKEVRGLNFNEELSELNLEHNSVIEENYINCKWTENASEIKKNEYNTGQIVPMDKKCKEILGNIVRPEYSEIEKTMAIYAYIVENIKYDNILLKREKELRDKGENIGKGVSKILNGKQSSYNAFMKGEVVCEGYTNMMHYMLSSVGIESKAVSCIGKRDNGEESFVDRGENHSVIRVKTGDDWYYYDPTWDAGKMELRNAFKTKEEFEKNHTFTVLEEKIESPKEKVYTTEEINERLRYVLEDRKNIVLEKKEKEPKENNFNRLYQRYGVTGNDLGREVDELNNIDEKEFKERNNEKERLDRESGEKDARSFDERA